MIALRLTIPPVGKRRGGERPEEEQCLAEKVGTRQRGDIQRAGSSPAPITANLKHLLKKQHGDRADSLRAEQYLLRTSNKVSIVN